MVKMRDLPWGNRPLEGIQMLLIVLNLVFIFVHKGEFYATSELVFTLHVLDWWFLFLSYMTAEGLRIPQVAI